MSTEQTVKIVITESGIAINGFDGSISNAAIWGIGRLQKYLAEHSGLQQNPIITDKDHSALNTDTRISPSVHPCVTLARNQISRTDRRVADVFRLAAAIIRDQDIEATYDDICYSPIGDAAVRLIMHAGSTRKYYSGSGFKLGACIRMIDGGDVDFILSQYRGFVTSHDKARLGLSKHSRLLDEMVNSGAASATHNLTQLAISLSIFDVNNRDTRNILKLDVPGINQLTRYAQDQIIELLTRPIGGHHVNQ